LAIDSAGDIDTALMADPTLPVKMFPISEEGKKIKKKFGEIYGDTRDLTETVRRE
jgi:hypothetical protein